MPLTNLVRGRAAGALQTPGSRSAATPAERKQEFYRLHHEACTHLRAALDSDEINQVQNEQDETRFQSKRTTLMDQYWKSITSMEKAIQYFVNNIETISTNRCKTSTQNSTGPDMERARSTCDKLRSNKQLATDRIERLETMQMSKDAGKPIRDAAKNRLNSKHAGDGKVDRMRPTSANFNKDNDISSDEPERVKKAYTFAKPVNNVSRQELAATGIAAVASRSRPAVPKAAKSNLGNDNQSKKIDRMAAGSSSISRSSSNGRIKAAPVAVKPKATKLAADPKTEARDMLRGIDRELADRILDNILQMDDKISLDSVQGQEAAKQALHELVILPAVRPEIFTGLRAPIRGLLLYGPPGNGKTMLAKAVAGEAGLRFFNISASALTSKWIGDGEKLVRALFACAKILQPSVIFVDEIDSLLKSRSDSEHDSMRRLKTEFLIQFDGVDSSSEDRILVMGATNRPWELDEAATRRFPKRVYVQLPDKAARMAIIERLLRDQQHSLTKKQMQSLAEATEGYSGSDLTNLARDAALGPVRLYTPDVLKKLDVKKLRPIIEQDFQDSLRRIRPSCSSELVEKLEEWSEQRGEG